MTTLCDQTGKIRYPSKGEARQALGSASRAVPKRRRIPIMPFHTYRCEHCGDWHNSSRPKRKDGLRRFTHE